MGVLIRACTILMVLAFVGGWLAANAVADTSAGCEQPQWCGAATDVNGDRSFVSGGSHQGENESHTGAIARTPVGFIVAGKEDYSGSIICTKGGNSHGEEYPRKHPR